MSKNIKNVLWGVFAVVLIVVCVVWFLNSNLEHIEDTNGVDDYSLTTITDENIINMDTGALGVETNKNALTGDTIEFSSEKFTGVYEILYDNYIAPSDFELNLTSFTVDKGNFKMVVVHNDKIVATLEPDMLVDYILEDVTGTVSLRIVGESAAFSFCMTQMEYDEFSHD